MREAVSYEEERQREIEEEKNAWLAKMKDAGRMPEGPMEPSMEDPLMEYAPMMEAAPMME